MQQLTPSAFQAVQELSQRYGVSPDAVTTLLGAVAQGGGTMAQFSHPELGGGGQWMQGGMTMVGDMFNSGLQSTVSGLCSELSSLLSSQQVFVPPPAQAGSAGPGNNWWPPELGQPSSSGGQNGVRYAYFPAPRRLALDAGGVVSLYDTLDNQIGGVQQQQGQGPGSLEFTSQYGTFTVASLPLVSSNAGGGAQQASPPAQPAPPPAQPPAPTSGFGEPTLSRNEVFSALEKLGDLQQRGILTEAEFASKKAELLSRL